MRHTGVARRMWIVVASAAVPAAIAAIVVWLTRDTAPCAIPAVCRIARPGGPCLSTGACPDQSPPWIWVPVIFVAGAVVAVTIMSARRVRRAE